MSKIVIITNHSYMLYRFRRELIQQLQKTHQVVLVMPFVGHEADFQAMGLRCIHTPVDRRGINPKTDLKLMKRYQELLKAEQPDLVITYSIKPNIYGGLAAAKLGIPYWANVQGLGTAFQRKGLAQLVTLLYRAAFRKVQMVFFENEINAEEFRNRKILPAEKQKVLSGAGVNLEEYPMMAHPANQIPHLLYLGRIMREKGMDELFSAVRYLWDEGCQFQLDLVGFFEDEYKEQVEELEKLGIAKFHGFQPDPRPYYAQADCVVLPSYHEGMSNVLLEGAATGRPLITSDIPGCREAVEDGVTGLLCQARNEESLRHALKCFLELSPADRAAMGCAGRAKMEAQFDKRKVVKETIAALPLEQAVNV